ECDALGRQVVRRQGEFELRAEVDPAARTVAWHWPEEVSVLHEADEAGLPRALTCLGRRIEFEHDTSGRPIARRYSDGLRASYRYDPRGRIAGFALGDGTRTLLDRSLGYDGGRIATLADADGEAAIASYDARGRVSRVAGASASESYRFDERDNLIASHRLTDTTIRNGDQLRTAGERS